MVVVQVGLVGKVNFVIVTGAGASNKFQSMLFWSLWVVWLFTLLWLSLNCPVPLLLLLELLRVFGFRLFSLCA